MVFWDTNLILCGIIVIVFGTVCALLSTIILYGFGELIDCVSKISNNIGNLRLNNNNYIIDDDDEINLCDINSDDVVDVNDNAMKDDLSTKGVIALLLIIVIIILFVWIISG